MSEPVQAKRFKSNHAYIEAFLVNFDGYRIDQIDAAAYCKDKGFRKTENNEENAQRESTGHH